MTEPTAPMTRTTVESWLKRHGWEQDRHGTYHKAGHRIVFKRGTVRLERAERNATGRRVWRWVMAENLEEGE